MWRSEKGDVALVLEAKMVGDNVLSHHIKGINHHVAVLGVTYLRLSVRRTLRQFWHP